MLDYLLVVMDLDGNLKNKTPFMKQKYDHQPENNVVNHVSCGEHSPQTENNVMEMVTCGEHDL